MTLTKILTLAIVLGGFATTASAKEFRFPLAMTAENDNGNYNSLAIDRGAEGPLVYEIVPATNEISGALKAKKCKDGVRVDASVLARHLEFDDENHRPGTETLKILVRKLDCLAL